MTSFRSLSQFLRDMLYRRLSDQTVVHNFVRSYLLNLLKLGFCQTFSSPRFLKSNEEAEKVVQTVKNLLKKLTDPYLALLSYRSTPLQNGISPAELLMGRKLRTRLPTLPSNLDAG